MTRGLINCDRSGSLATCHSCSIGIIQSNLSATLVVSSHTLNISLATLSPNILSNPDFTRSECRIFLVFFAVFSSTSSWDWIMSIDVHWFSTLFGWYTFAGIWCSSMTVLVMLTVYLKKQGYLPKVNDHHIHDIGKWTFATSFLWSYLWFSQYMLIWYANMGEEVIYYEMRIENFQFLYFGMFIVNFAFPMLLLMSREAKRHAGTLTVIGIIILLGHWMDVYVMVSGGSMGATASIGMLEIGMLALMAGIFIRIILNNLTKAPLSVVNHPYLDESIHHEI